MTGCHMVRQDLLQYTHYRKLCTFGVHADRFNYYWDQRKCVRRQAIDAGYRTRAGPAHHLRLRQRLIIFYNV